MESVKKVQFLNIIFLFALFIAAPAAAVFGIMVPLTSMYALL